jgi:2-dehydro-3-deoxy-D-arabinonate dehydratase
MSHLAVIQTQSNPYHLVKEINGKYFEIEKIKTLSEALSLHMADFRKSYDAAGSTEVKGKLVAPVAIDTEVWGAGVTYQRSRDARKEESGIPDVYQLVYEADRPELFFKATARRTVGHEGEVGNIEGENPLYLSQAKIYYGSNALGPMIRPIWEIIDHEKLDIYAKIERAGSIVWQAETSLKSLNRSFDDLIDYLFKCQHFPVGVVLSTGTGIVPPLDISLMAGDVVTITVDQIGTLVNKVALTPEDINDRIK